MYAAMVKVICPSDYCDALLNDRPDAVQEHWQLCHRELGERPRALRVVLPVPKCKVRWRRYPGQRERQIGRARVMSIAPAQAEWEDSAECRAYPVDNAQRNHDEGVVALDPAYAHPKRQVSTFENLVPLQMWQGQPDIPPEVDRWLWRAVADKVGAQECRGNYPLSDESEVEGTKRQPGKSTGSTKSQRGKARRGKREKAKISLVKPPKEPATVTSTPLFSPISSQTGSEREVTVSTPGEVTVGLPQVQLVDSASTAGEVTDAQDTGRPGFVDILAQALQNSGLPSMQETAMSRLKETVNGDKEIQQALEEIIAEDTDLALDDGTEPTLAEEVGLRPDQDPLAHWPSSGQIVTPTQLAELEGRPVPVVGRHPAPAMVITDIPSSSRRFWQADLGSPPVLPPVEPPAASAETSAVAGTSGTITLQDTAPTPMSGTESDHPMDDGLSSRTASPTRTDPPPVPSVHAKETPPELKPSQRILISAVQWLQTYFTAPPLPVARPRITPPAKVWGETPDAFQRMDAEAQREDHLADEAEAEILEVDEEETASRQRYEARRARLKTKRNHHRGRAYAIREERRRRERYP